MEAYKTFLKDWCFMAPHWMQLQIQAFWYGFISYLMECAEAKIPPNFQHMTLEDMMAHSHSEFRQWPTNGLEEHVNKVLALHLTEEQLNQFYEDLAQLFQDVVPVDLNIFTVLAEGKELTEEEVKRLYDSVAFLPPLQPQLTKKRSRHTRRIHGRRAITPIRRRGAKTHHARAHKPSNLPIQIIKTG